MARMIDQIRASKLPSNMMQFAARGALQVSAAENIEILVYLARHNKVFGDTARMTLAGWDEKASLAVAADPQSPVEVLDYLISGDNLRPSLLPLLLENPSVYEQQIAKLATSAMRDTIDVMLKSERVHKLNKVLDTLKSNPYLKKEEAEALRKPSATAAPASAEPQGPPPVAEAVGGAIRRALRHDGDPYPLTDESVHLHDPVFAVLRARDSFLTAAQIATAVRAEATARGIPGAALGPPAVLRRLADLSRDFHVETASSRDGLAYRLGEFRAFLGQVDHVRHEQFSTSRATIS